MTEKSQRARKDTATVAEASPPPAATATEAETPDLRSLLEQVLTKLSAMDTRLSNLENKATTSEVLSSEGSPAQGGRPPGAFLRRALEGPTVEEMDTDRLRMEQEELSRPKNKNKLGKLKKVNEQKGSESLFVISGVLYSQEKKITIYATS